MVACARRTITPIIMAPRTASTNSTAFRLISTGSCSLRCVLQKNHQLSIEEPSSIEESSFVYETDCSLRASSSDSQTLTISTVGSTPRWATTSSSILCHAGALWNYTVMIFLLK